MGCIGVFLLRMPKEGNKKRTVSIRVEVGCPCVGYDNCVTTDGFHIPGRSCEHGHLRGQTAVPVPCVVLQRQLQIVERPQRRLAPIVSLVRRHHPFTRGCIQAEAADEQSWQWASRGSLTAGVRWCTNTAVFARAWIVASRAWIVNRPCARLNLTEAASGLAIRSSRIVHVLELVPGGTRSEKLSRMCTFPVPSRPSCTYFPFRFECSYSMKVHRRDAHGAVREVRDGERVWWNGHTNEWVYGCSAPSRSIDRCCTVR